MNNIPLVFWLIPIASVVALAMAWFFFRSMMKEEEGTDRMKEIAAHVRKGAMAYLKQQYKVVTIVFIVLAIIFAFMAYVLQVQNPWVPFAFLTGGLFSGLAGFFGMKTATYASARTANGARSSLDKGLKIAFRSGAVMGLVVVGLGLLDIAIWFIVLNAVYDGEATALVTITTTMLTFGMGASTQALFARVGGGIYTKAADVGADLVGKVEANIPEDDPRNPATIADNVGDNVGDVAGMGADLYESYLRFDIVDSSLRSYSLCYEWRHAATCSHCSNDYRSHRHFPFVNRYLLGSHQRGCIDERAIKISRSWHQCKCRTHCRCHIYYIIFVGHRELAWIIVLCNQRFGSRSGDWSGYRILYLA